MSNRERATLFLRIAFRARWVGGSVERAASSKRQTGGSRRDRPGAVEKTERQKEGKAQREFYSGGFASV